MSCWSSHLPARHCLLVWVRSINTPHFNRLSNRHTYNFRQHIYMSWRRPMTVWKDGLRLKLQKSGVTGCMHQWISQYLIGKLTSPREWNLQRQEDTERRNPSGRRLEPYLIPCLHQWHCPRHASQSPGSHIHRRSGPVVLGGTPFNSKLQNAVGAEHLGRLDKPVACKNQFQEDHLYHLQPFNKGTEGHPAY